MHADGPATGTPSGRDRPTALADILRQATQASLDPSAVLEVVVRWCTRTVGDLAGVRTLSEDGTVLQAGPAAHRDAAAEALAVEALASGRELAGEPITRGVVETLETAFLPEGLPPAAPGRTWDAYLRAVGIGSLIVAPLRSRGRALGVLTVARDRRRPAFEPADVDLVTEVAQRIGLVYDNARLYERVRVQAATLEHVDAAVVAVDADARITSFNPAAQRLFRLGEPEALGLRPQLALCGESDARVAEARRTIYREGRYAADWRLRRSDGEEFEAHLHAVAVRDDDGRVTGVVALVQDLTERLGLISQLHRRAAQQAAVAELGERALEAEEPGRLLHHAVASVRRTLGVELAGLFVLGEDGRTLRLRAGDGFGPATPLRATVPAGWHDSQEGFTLIRREPVICDDVAGERRFAQAELMAAHGARSGVTVVVQGRGGPHAVLAAHSATAGAFTGDDVSFLQSMANVLGDALDRARSEAEIRRRSLHDPLTELPNRSLVMDRLVHALARLGRAEGQVALIFLDLDHFKAVNDSLGHRAGDEVLVQVAERLRAAVRPADTVGRFGGDEFIVLCEEVEDEAMALAIAERLAGAFAQPFPAGGDEHVIGASIGIALYDAEQDADALLRDADRAMYRAKERGRGRIELFDTGMRAGAEDRLRTEAGLRRALDEDELELHYQPIVELRDLEIVGVEALVRWRHPERGLLAPGAFIPIAEDSGLIIPLGRRVLELACRQVAAWRGLGPGGGHLPVHVNLSPRQLHDQALLATVRGALVASGAPASALTLEITESMLIDRGPARLELLAQLRALGVQLALDDFGTGWSSLGYLAQLPIGELKIDRSFVAGLATGHAPIVDAIVRLARAFHLPVVAEGVEDEEQLEALRRLGCGLAQGFLFSRPLPAAELGEVLRARRGG